MYRAQIQKDSPRGRVSGGGGSRSKNVDNCFSNQLILQFNRRERVHCTSIPKKIIPSKQIGRPSARQPSAISIQGSDRKSP